MLQLLCRCYLSCRPRLCRVSPRHPAMDSTIRYTLSLMERKHLQVRHGPGAVKRSTNSVVLSLNRCRDWTGHARVPACGWPPSARTPNLAQILLFFGPNPWPKFQRFWPKFSTFLALIITFLAQIITFLAQITTFLVHILDIFYRFWPKLLRFWPKLLRF